MTHWHRNLMQAVVSALKAVFRDARPADRAVQAMIQKHGQWGAQDRRWAAETVYDVVRYWRLLWAVANAAPTTQDRALARLVGVHRALRGDPLPDWEEFEGLRPDRLKKRQSELSQVRALRESVPDWLDELGERALGERWDTELAMLNRPAAVVLRTNTLKTTRAELQRILAEEGIETDPIDWAPDALVLRSRANALITRAFRAGLFEVQDAASQQVAPFLGVQPGMRVVDACAGAGGKTLHLAALMRNRGVVVALDVDDRRLQELRRRARRAGVSNVTPRRVTSSKVIKRLQDSADRLLLDVPCSGLGTLRRAPDLKWRLTPEALDRLTDTQREILDRHARVARPGGRLVYATCSLLPQENERQIEAFLRRHGDAFRCLEQRTLWPSQTGYDGFYMALLERRR